MTAMHPHKTTTTGGARNLWNGAAGVAQRVQALTPGELAREVAATPDHELLRGVRGLDRETYRIIERQLEPVRRRRIRRMLSLPEEAVGARQRTDLPAVTETAPAARVVRTLDEGVRSVYVVSGDGRYLGLSDRDILRRLGDRPAGTGMYGLRAAHELDGVAHAADRMRREGLDEVPVVDSAGRLTGRLCLEDVHEDGRSGRWLHGFPGRLGLSRFGVWAATGIAVTALATLAILI